MHGCPVDGALNIICKGSDRAPLRVLTIKTGVLEGPTALPIFRFDISVSISSGVIGVLSRR